MGRRARRWKGTKHSSGLAPYNRESPVRQITDISEARKLAGAKSRSMSLAWDDTEALGIAADMRRSGMLSEWDRKDTLYKAYINNTWISSCIEVIAKRITSGGFVIEELAKGKGSEDNRLALDNFCGYINEDEDFNQFIRSIAIDILIYGECYVEIVRKNGVPWQLHKIDCQTMSFKLSQQGNILQYTQHLEKSQDKVDFTPEDVIRWWLPSPRASKLALSPIERLLNPTDIDSKMVDWARGFFRRGAKSSFWVKLGDESQVDDANRFIKYFRENYTGIQNAHVPPVLYNGAELKEFGKGSIDVDFTKGRSQSRDEVLAVFGVPPALVGVIESGNIGGGTGEDQEKSFRYNTVEPIRQIILEKLNYRVVQHGFRISDWMISTRLADFRDDKVISDIQDKRLRSGCLTINEVRQELGKGDLPGGDTPFVVAGKDIVPVEVLAEMADNQRQQTQLDLEQKKTQVDKAKNPQPVPTALQQDQASLPLGKDVEKPDEEEEE